MIDWTEPTEKELIETTWRETASWEPPMVWADGYGLTEILQDWRIAPSMAGGVDATCCHAKNIDEAKATVRAWLEEMLKKGAPVQKIGGGN